MTEYESTLTAAARFADLDAQRHVTSRTYEYLASEARQQVLNRHGYPLSRLLEEQIVQRPRACSVRFVNQQFPGAPFQIPAAAYPQPDGAILWDHALRQNDGKPICRIVHAIEARRGGAGDENGKTVELVSGGPRSFPDAHLLAPVPEFTGSCQRLSLPFQTLMSDRAPNGYYEPGALWRIFEDGRMIFGERIGLTLELIQALDTTLFFMAATFQFYQPIRPATPVQILSWVERTDKIRAYMRQDVTDPEGKILYMSAQEEHLIVSLSRSRPRRAPPQFLDIFRDYLEFPDA